MHRLALVLALLLFSCGPTTRPDFVIHLVDGMGGNPFSSRCQTGTIRIDVAQGTSAVLTTNGSIGAGPISVQIPSYGLLTQIQVTAACTGEEPLIGSTPEFVPVGFGFVNIVLGRPSECIAIQQPTLSPSMIGSQFVRVGVNVVVMGGVDASERPNIMLQGFDTLSFTHNAAPQNYSPALPTPVGFGRALRILDTRILFVSTPTSGIYDTAPNLTTRYSAIQDATSAAGLHVGAGAESAVVDFGTGIAVVGGATGDEAAPGITWITVTPTGLQLASGQLAYARRRPAVVYLQNKLLIAGGQGAGEPLFELVTRMSADPAIAFGTPSEQRFAPVLTTDANHTAAFLTLGSSSVGDDRMQDATSYELSGCTTNAPTPGCTIASGPAFPDAPRARVAVVEHHVGGMTQGSDDYESLVVGGLETAASTSTSSVLVDRIHFADAHFTIVPAGMLVSPRALPGATEIGGGVVLVGGGADDRENPIGTVELCFPEHLAPITSL